VNIEHYTASTCAHTLHTQAARDTALRYLLGVDPDNTSAGEGLRAAKAATAGTTTAPTTAAAK
jgi:hypothetical protein